MRFSLKLCNRAQTEKTYKYPESHATLMIDIKSMKVAGGVFHARVAEIKRRYGEEGLRKIYDYMKQRGYKGTGDFEKLKIKEPVPLEHLLLFLHGIEDVYGIKELRENSRSAVKRRGIVGIFVKWAGTPELLIRKASEMWPEFYSFGRLEGEVIEEGHGVLRGYNLSPEPFFCEQVLTEYFYGIMENLKLRDLHITHTKCVHRGDNFCEWELRWKK